MIYSLVDKRCADLDWRLMGEIKNYLELLRKCMDWAFCIFKGAKLTKPFKARPHAWHMLLRR